MKLELDEEKIPEKDLAFTYERENPHEPLCTLANECACLTFFLPESAKSNYDNYVGEYIFVLDRSGSMYGKRIEQAKNALILFLKSLPEKSKYNIISFGSRFERHYEESIHYTDENLMETIKLIESFDADFGGTEICSPLLSIVQNDKQMGEYFRNVILLTDGQVGNPENVIQILKLMKQNNIATTHMVGIGDGVSFDMIRRGAQESGGEHLFIMNNEEMQKQIIYLLESITKFEISQFNL